MIRCSNSSSSALWVDLRTYVERSFDVDLALFGGCFSPVYREIGKGRPSLDSNLCKHINFHPVESTVLPRSPTRRSTRVESTPVRSDTAHFAGKKFFTE